MSIRKEVCHHVEARNPGLQIIFLETEVMENAHGFRFLSHANITVWRDADQEYYR